MSRAALLDTERRAELMARSRSLRVRTNATMERLNDNGVRTMMKVSVLHPLDDIDGLFLDAPDARPSTLVDEDMWLNSASLVLTAETLHRWHDATSPGLD
jgi:hypothetical protein